MVKNMHVLFLSSAHPNLGHSQSLETVLGALMQAVANLGHKVSWVVDNPVNSLNASTKQLLDESGIHFLGDFSGDMEPEDNRHRFLRRLTTVRRAILPKENDDFPRFQHPASVASQIESIGADVAILHWDTWFEYLLPYLKRLPVVGYWAKPRYDASMIRMQKGLPGLPPDPLRRWMAREFLEHQRERHFKRAGLLKALSNICAVDVAMYNKAGISCNYIPNTWPDAFGSNWRDRRKAAENATDFGILGSIGAVHATGNQIGIAFWRDDVLPYLEENIHDEAWTVNMCGYGFDKLPDEIALLLDHPRINRKGFVPDMDHEMLANELFLMCNNAGPYTGGYTRVVYAMSAGACLVGHKCLTDSMPEVKTGENALLGSSGREIAELIVQAYRNPELRSRIGTAARETYERYFHPGIVAKKLISQVEHVTESSRG